MKAAIVDTANAEFQRPGVTAELVRQATNQPAQFPKILRATKKKPNNLGSVEKGRLVLRWFMG